MQRNRAPPGKRNVRSRVQPGYSRFQDAFSAEGYEDVSDIMFDLDHLPHSKLQAMLEKVDAKPVHVRRIAAGVEELRPTLERWLDDGVKAGFSRYAAAFSVDGYDDVADLRVDPPNMRRLERILAGVGGVKSPQVAHLARALEALTGIPMAAMTVGSTISPPGGGGGRLVEGDAAAAATVEAPAATVEAPAPHAKAVAAATFALAEAKEALAHAEADAVQINAEGASTSVDDDLVRSDREADEFASATAWRPRPLLPDGKHAMLSYQWNVQGQVAQIKDLLNQRNVKCWMDIDGGMKNDIYDSMAEGVQDAACLICFMTQAYQDSVNCKLELKFAQQSGVPIIPVMMQADFAAKGWLAILTAGSIWTPMHESESVLAGVDKLITLAHHIVPGMSSDGGDVSGDDGASEVGSSFDVGAWGDGRSKIPLSNRDSARGH